MSFFKKITFGRYIDTGSDIHKLDPRTKLITLVAASIMIFYSATPDKSGALTLVGLFTISLLIIILARLSIGYVSKCILKFLWFFLFIFIFHSFFTPGRVIPELSQYGLIVTREGLSGAAFMSAKLYIVIQMTYIFILTTSPLEITAGVASLFGFLKLFRVPVDDLAMMVTLAIKFIPTFFKEIKKVIAAQQARGIVFSEGSITKRIKTASLIFTPIFYSIFTRADELNRAMISRGYRAGAKRSRYKRLGLGVRDYLVLVVVATLVVLLNL